MPIIIEDGISHVLQIRIYPVWRKAVYILLVSLYGICSCKQFVLKYVNIMLCDLHFMLLKPAGHVFLKNYICAEYWTSHCIKNEHQL